jgi:hypothetical protein|nr:MAG TPA: hypothetical protein [Caudoviricetes sp.]
MEIKLNAGDKITIPTGCKATIEDDLIIIEEKQEEFKDGDILRSTISNRTIIFKSYKKDSKIICNIHYNNCDIVNDLGWDISHYYLATEEEKQAFFNELYTKGLRWNAETKQMEKIRKRAKKGEPYLTIDRLGEVAELTEIRCTIDDEIFNSGNYYLPSERKQAEEDAKAVRAIFEKRLKVK